MAVSVQDEVRPKVLITGAAGFIGSHLVDMFLSDSRWIVFGIDSFEHSGESERVSAAQAQSSDYRIFTADLSVPLGTTLKREMGAVDVIINLAADSSVDKSLVDPERVIRNNTGIAVTVLELARDVGASLFIQMSTDEVYGPTVPPATYSEWSSIRPSNPYSASKACQEAIAFAYWRSYGVPVLIVNSTNVFGERQGRDKYIPIIVSSITRGQELGVHCDDGLPGSRQYLYVADCVRALKHLVDKSREGLISALTPKTLPPRFNIAGGTVVDNLELARRVADIMTTTLTYRLVDGSSARTGHDLHYGLDATRLQSLGWSARVPFDQALRQTVEWYGLNPAWLV